MDGFISTEYRINCNKEIELIVLGIETSCDETASAICKDGQILSSITSTQQIHKKYGGVVPEIASREHDKLLNQMVFDLSLIHI